MVDDADISNKRVQKTLLLKMPKDLALDLVAFSEANHGAPRSRIVRKAIEQFIELELSSNPVLRQRFADEKLRLGKPSSEAIRLVDATAKLKK